MERFSDEQYFQMNDEEFLNWKSQIVISNGEKMGLRKAPYVFTLEGIKILSTILRKPNVKNVTEEIVKAFANIELKNNQSLTVPVFKGNMVQNLIHGIDGIPIILDIDLAQLYDCKMIQKR